MKIFGATQKNSPHKMFLHRCILHYVHTLKLNDATLASLGKLKYSRWRPRWPPKDKILNIFLSMWARHIIFVATHRFLRSKNRLSILKPISDYMFTKWRTRWPPKHKTPNIFFQNQNQNQNQNCLLVIRPRTIIHQDLCLGKLVPSPHKRSKLSN